MQSESQEINLTRIISAVSNKKREGLLVFCLVFFTGLALVFILPWTYQTTEILRIGRIDENQIETVDALKMLFQSETKLNEIAKELNLSFARVKKDFSIEGKMEEPFIIIKGRGKSPEEAMKIVKLVSSKILERQEKLYKPAQEKFEKEIATIEKEKKSTEEKIAQKEKIIERLQADIAFYQSEIVKRGDVQLEAQGRIVGTYIKVLDDVKRTRDETAEELLDIKQHLIVLEENLQQKKFAYVHLSRAPGVEIEAVMPEKSFISPNIIQNMIYLVVLGIFLAVLWVFIRTFHIKQQAM